MESSVLVLHSNAALASSFSMQLEEMGFRVVAPESVDFACQAIRISRPDLVLLDGDMLLQDLSLCRKLRLCYPEQRLPIVLLIPPGEQQVSRYLCGTDVDDYLCQPYAAEELEARLMLRLSMGEKNSVRPLPNIDFSFLNKLSKLATSSLSYNEILQQVVNSVAAVIDVNRCSVLLLGDHEAAAKIVASSDDPGVSGLNISLDRYPEIAETIRSKRPLLIDNIFDHPLMQNVRQYLQNCATRSILVLPMIDRDKMVGVMILRSNRPITGFSEDEVYFCQLVTNVATSALRLVEVNALESKVGQRKPAVATAVKGNGGMQSSLLDVAAHDLRVLVSVIDGYCVLLSETIGEKLQPEQNEIVKGLMAGNRRLVDMANDLLDFSQLSSGSFSLNLAEHDIGQVASAVCTELSPLMSRRNIHFRINGLSKELLLICDQHAIQRVFYNILNNAIKFTPEGGEISLSLKQIESEVQVAIEDNGNGIEPDRIATLFDEYTTASKADARTGNGLGLSICKKIVAAHHGRIWAESFLGQGSRFIFCLPL